MERGVLDERNERVGRDPADERAGGDAHKKQGEHHINEQYERSSTGGRCDGLSLAKFDETGYILRRNARGVSTAK